MRVVYALFAVSAALFVAGLGFLVVGARMAQRPAPTPAAVITPVASVKQIMAGIVGPAANVVFESVVTNVTAAGIEEKAPRTDAEWAVVGNSAAALIESGNLLMIGNRAVDKGDWIRMSRALIDAGKEALRATEAKNADAVLASGDTVNQSCDNCHEKYQRR